MAKKKSELDEIRALKADIDSNRKKSEKAKKTQKKHPIIGTALKIASIGKIAKTTETVLRLVLPVLFAVFAVILSLIRPAED